MSLVLGKDYKKHLSKFRKYLREISHEDTIVQMLGNKIVKKALLESIPSLSRLTLGSYEGLKAAIGIAESLSNSEPGTTIGDYNLVKDLFNTGRTSEDYPDVFDGIGLLPGEVGLIEALPKGGKTLSLTHIGALHLAHGLKVYQWSLEIPKSQVFSRYAGRLTGDPTDLDGANKRMKLFGGELLVRDEPYATMREIRKWSLKGKPDMLMIDYADLIIPASKMKERRFEIREVYLAIRNLAKELDIPIWTASQATAKAEAKVMKGGLIGMDDLEEAKIVKAGICSLILSLNQTPEEKEDMMLRMYTALSTHGFPRPVRSYEVDYVRQLIYGGDSDH